MLNALTGTYHKYYESAGYQDPGMHALQAIPLRYFLGSLLGFPCIQHREKRSTVNGLSPSTWSWIWWIAPIGCASDDGMSFSHFAKWEHLDDGACNMINRCCLSFQEDDVVKHSLLSYPPRRHDNPNPRQKCKIEPKELLRRFSRDNSGAAAPLGSSARSARLRRSIYSHLYSSRFSMGQGTQRTMGALLRQT